MIWIKSKTGEHTHFLQLDVQLSKRFHVQIEHYGQAELTILDLHSKNVFTNRFHESMHPSLEDAKKAAEKALKPFLMAAGNA